MGHDVSCRLLCHTAKDPMNWNEEYSLLVLERIQHEYTVHLSVTSAYILILFLKHRKKFYFTLFELLN